MRDETQSLAIVGGIPATGTAVAAFMGKNTAPLDIDSTALDVQYALNKLDTIGTGGVVCYGGPWPATPIAVVFVGPHVSKRNVPQLTVTDTFDVGNVTTVVLEAGGLTPGGTVTCVITCGGVPLTVAPTVSHLGGGTYAVDWVPNKAGVHKLVSSGTLPTPHTHTKTVTVDP